MINTRRAIYGYLFASLLGLGGCGAGDDDDEPANPNVLMTAQLSGANEVPPVSTNASGTVDASLDNSTNVMGWTITYSGLSGPATAAHFHGPALVGQNAGVALGIVGSLESPIRGSATLTTAQVADLLAGRLYFNVHTAANPGGEIRGQVNTRP